VALPLARATCAVRGPSRQWQRKYLRGQRASDERVWRYWRKQLADSLGPAIALWIRLGPRPCRALRRGLWTRCATRTVCPASGVLVAAKAPRLFMDAPRGLSRGAAASLQRIGRLAVGMPDRESLAQRRRIVPLIGFFNQHQWSCERTFRTARHSATCSRECGNSARGVRSPGMCPSRDCRRSGAQTGTSAAIHFFRSQFPTVQALRVGPGGARRNIPSAGR